MQGQTNKQGKATQHTQGSHFFLRKMSCLGWDSSPRHSTLQTMYIYTCTCTVSTWLSGEIPVGLVLCFPLLGVMCCVCIVRIVAWSSHHWPGPVHVPTPAARELPTVTQSVTTQTHCRCPVLQTCTHTQSYTLYMYMQRRPWYPWYNYTCMYMYMFLNER